jgi:hypothetical protein
MPISENALTEDACSGIVAAGFQDVDQMQDRIEAFLEQALPLCIRYLPGIADGSIQRKGEKELAASLCKRLQAIACEKKVLFTFFNEDPDIGKGARTDDMSVLPFVGMAYLKIGAHYYNCEDQLYIIEAKRLPTPSRVGQGDRSREYVVSDWNNRNSPRKSRTGGIERFKEGLHGGAFGRSAMVAFIQRESADLWLARVNSWIKELVANPISCHRARWNTDDLLISVPCQSVSTGVSVLCSKHLRSNGTSYIALRHYWLMLN